MMTRAETVATMAPPIRRVARGTISRPPADLGDGRRLHLVVGPAEMPEHALVAPIAHQLVGAGKRDRAAGEGE